MTLEHRGWDSLRLDHPARLGLGDPAFTTAVGRFWADRLLAAKHLGETSAPRRRD